MTPVTSLNSRSLRRDYMTCPNNKKKPKSIENIASWGPVSPSLKNSVKGPGNYSSEPVKNEFTAHKKLRVLN